ncbi:glycosyltransferase family 4 protein [Patellaria atrata CBS 101060]|uniref:Alpha-1,3/1,6-mannosyltransferase ALG2 n=1 Tax=Patellaria atrata CBS 101060 TaxID=1346257 RepID=A0A9P4SA79_9PEZI|nr:glycosyltransferase family 4 protein [Patellaria atrata CBS 101060]
MAPKGKKNIVFLHPDLGIGGAERLVIDAAVGLQNSGHKVTIFTSHCDPKHCFDEARDGTLDVRVRGNTIVPPSILGRFAILCAIIRQVHLVLQICVLSSELKELQPDAFFVDQLSAGVPLLRLLQPEPRVLFYCHFPDKLLAQKGGWLKCLYRSPFDKLESWSTGCSDAIVVNSNFTKSVFASAFPRLRDRSPRVVYPCVDTTVDAKETSENEKPLWPNKKIILSINRFEAKKGVELALKAYAALTLSERATTRLVIAGGYDQRISENIIVHASLEALTDSLNLTHATCKTIPTALSIPSDISVLFLLSIPASFKSLLLASASLLVYTPRNEHFGIVPLEAMVAGRPVLAANEGGPTETVLDGVTGWLRDVGDVDAWTEVMSMALKGEEKLKQMGEKGRERVKAEFSKEKMAARLEGEMKTMMRVARPEVVSLTAMKFLLGAVGAVVAAWAFVLLVLYNWLTGKF